MQRIAVADLGTGEIGLPEIAPRRIILDRVVEGTAEQEIARAGASPLGGLRIALLLTLRQTPAVERLLRGRWRLRLRPQGTEVEAGDAGVPGGVEAPGHGVGDLRADGAPEAGQPGGLQRAVVVDPPQGPCAPPSNVVPDNCR